MKPGLYKELMNEALGEFGRLRNCMSGFQEGKLDWNLLRELENALYAGLRSVEERESEREVYLGFTIRETFYSQTTGHHCDTRQGYEIVELPRYGGRYATSKKKAKEYVDRLRKSWEAGKINKYSCPADYEITRKLWGRNANQDKAEEEERDHRAKMEAEYKRKEAERTKRDQLSALAPQLLETLKDIVTYGLSAANQQKAEELIARVG